MSCIFVGGRIVRGGSSSHMSERMSTQKTPIFTLFSLGGVEKFVKYVGENLTPEMDVKKWSGFESVIIFFITLLKKISPTKNPISQPCATPKLYHESSITDVPSIKIGRGLH